MTSHIASVLQDAWKALEAKNYADADHLFKKVIQAESEEEVKLMDIVDAHNGLGAVAIVHKDLLDARRWFHEAKYLLERHYDGHWPKSLSWQNWEERIPLYTLLGYGHVEYLGGDLHKAKEHYERVLALDPKDGAHAKRYIEDIMVGKSFKDLM